MPTPLIELIRYGKRPGQRGRQLIRTGNLQVTGPVRKESAEI
jgi:hypothetical protein